MWNLSDGGQISVFRSLRVGMGFQYRKITQGNFGRSGEMVLLLDCDGGDTHLSKLIELNTKKWILLFKF